MSYTPLARAASASFLPEIALSDGSAPLTTLAHDSAGLTILWKRELDATWTSYTSGSNEIEAIGTIGTYSAPSTGKIRFGHTGSDTGIYQIMAPQAAFNGSDGSRHVEFVVQHADIAGGQAQTRVPLAAADLQNASNLGLLYLDGELSDIPAAVANYNGTGFANTIWGTVLNISTNTAQLLTRLTTTRAGYLDNLSGGAVALASSQSTIIGHLTDIKGATFDTSTDSLEAIRDRDIPSAETIAGRVRTELAAELNIITTNLDTTVSSRLASSGYSAPPSAATIASQVRAELGVELARIDTAVSTRMETFSYSAPPSASDIAQLVLSMSIENVEATADPNSLAALVLIGTNSTLSGTSLTAKKISDGSAFHTYTVTIDASADPVTGITG